MYETSSLPPVEAQGLADSLNTAHEIFGRTGVQLSDSSLSAERVIELADAVATEANAMGFTLECDDEEAKGQAERLLADYTAYTDSAKYYGYDKAKKQGLLPQDYDRRQPVKTLLIKSSARDLARRVGVDGSVLDTEASSAIKGKTGVDLTQFHQGYPLIQPEVRPKVNKPVEKKSDYSGPVGSWITVSGVGSTAIVGYSQHGKPMIRDPRIGQVVSTFGKYS